MCCTVKKAPIKAATCSVDLCAKIPGYCPATDNDTFPPNLQALREWFRMEQGPCLGRNIEYGFFSTHDDNPDTSGLEVEHPIDRQVLVTFFDTVNTRILPSGATSQFTAIDRDTLRSINPDGVPVGIQPDTQNDRLFEALGSNNYPYPFSLVEKQINGAKGRLMGGKAPTAVTTVRKHSTKALKSRKDEDINTMLQDVRVGFSIFDYLNKTDVSERFDAVRHQVPLQAGYVEEDVPELPELAARWVEFFNDFVQTRQEQAQNWLGEASNKVDLFQYGMVVTTLDGFLDMIDNMVFPADTQPSMQNPDPNTGF
ncbi:hypothetical protein BDW62DRAFT_214104 [Aspergillus aurantiobrunneus]